MQDLSGLKEVVLIREHINWQHMHSVHLLTFMFIFTFSIPERCPLAKTSDLIILRLGYSGLLYSTTLDLSIQY